MSSNECGSAEKLPPWMLLSWMLLGDWDVENRYQKNDVLRREELEQQQEEKLELEEKYTSTEEQAKGLSKRFCS